MKKCTWPQKFQRESQDSLTSALFSEGSTGCEPTPEAGKAAEETAPKWCSEFFHRKLCCGCWSHCGVFISFVMTCKRDSSQLQQQECRNVLLAALGALVVTSKILQVAGGAVPVLEYLLWLIWTVVIFLTKPQRTQHGALSFWQPQGWQHGKTNRGFHILS